MDPLAEMWARHEIERLKHAQLVILVRELREVQAANLPLIKAANERRKADMRQDGPTGFVMVRP